MPDDGPVVATSPEQQVVASEDDASVQHGLGEETTPEVLPTREPFRSLMRRLGLVEQAAGVTLVIVILGLVLTQVAQRYLPGGGWAWTGEISRYSMVWATFVMAGYLLAHDQHIAIKVVDFFLPIRLLALVKLLGHVLIAVTCIAGAYATYDFATHDRGQVTAAAEIPLTVIYSVVALGFASSALRAVLAMFVLDLPEIRSGEQVVA